MAIQDILGILAIFFCVTNLGSMGLELNVYKTVRSLRSYRFITLTLVWSWIIGPALATILTTSPRLTIGGMEIILDLSTVSG